MSVEEKLPLSEVINVLKSETIYRTNTWWCAVVQGEQFGHKKVFLYLWIKDKDGKWKRKQKATFGSLQTLEKIYEVAKRYLQELGGAYPVGQAR